MTDLGVLPKSAIFWHLDKFPSRETAESNRGGLQHQRPLAVHDCRAGMASGDG